MPSGFRKTIEELHPGDHACFLCETEEHHKAALTSFLLEGLKRGEKVVYFLDTHTAAGILDYLAKETGQVGRYLVSGQLKFLPAEQVYLRSGTFSPDAMMDLLRHEIQRALAEGYPALRATGEMSWALRGVAGSDRLIEYEARVNELFAETRCVALCQYDRREFSAATALEAVLTHPKVIFDHTLCDNGYYLLPENFLQSDIRTESVNRWLSTLPPVERPAAASSIQRGDVDRLLNHLSQPS